MQFKILLDMGKKEKRTIVIDAPNLEDAREWGQRQLAQWKKDGQASAEVVEVEEQAPEPQSE